MTTSSYKALLEPEQAGERRVMNITHPNPRRTSPVHDSQKLLDGRKRQKLSHSPEKRIFDPTTTIADAPAKITRGQESSSSDQSASRWFKEANSNFRPAQSRQSEIDGMLMNAVCGSIVFC